MPIKRYESRFHEEYLKVTLASGKAITLPFKGGGEYPKPHGGTFVTDNKEIQDALEGRRDFKDKIKIVLVVPTKEEELQKLAPKDPPKIEIPENKGLKPSTAEPIVPPVPEVQEEEVEPEVKEGVKETPVPEVESAPVAVTDVETFQQVRNYLCKTYPGTTFADVRSKEAAKKFAADKKIYFPNWVE